MECEVSPHLCNTRIARLLDTRKGSRSFDGRRGFSGNLGFLRRSIGKMDVTEEFRN
jgi:hypothetical protein